MLHESSDCFHGLSFIFRRFSTPRCFQINRRYFLRNYSSNYRFLHHRFRSQVFLILDIILQAIVDPSYLISLVFLTDIISVLSLVFDIGWIYQNFFFDYYEYTQFGLLSISNFILTNTIDFSAYIEILRYLRLVRILSWMRIFYESQKKWFMNESMQDNKSFQISRKVYQIVDFAI